MKENKTIKIDHKNICLQTKSLKEMKTTWRNDVVIGRVGGGELLISMKGLLLESYLIDVCI